MIPQDAVAQPWPRRRPTFVTLFAYGSGVFDLSEPSFTHDHPTVTIGVRCDPDSPIKEHTIHIDLPALRDLQGVVTEAIAALTPAEQVAESMLDAMIASGGTLPPAEPAEVE